jgi:hypothetical protein
MDPLIICFLLSLQVILYLIPSFFWPWEDSPTCPVELMSMLSQTLVSFHSFRHSQFPSISESEEKKHDTIPSVDART